MLNYLREHTILHQAFINVVVKERQKNIIETGKNEIEIRKIKQKNVLKPTSARIGANQNANYIHMSKN